MRRTHVNAGWYIDALPDGRYACLVPNQHLETHVGNLAFLDDQRQPLFVRVDEFSPALLRVAGQSWQTPETVAWDSQWTILPEATGVSPVIWLPDGRLQRTPYVYPDGSVCSQGWRYIDAAGTPINGDVTYGPSPQAPKLYEWTDLGRGDTLVVGQGEEGGVVIWDGTAHRLLAMDYGTPDEWQASGSCRFIRAHRTGDDVAIAFYRDLGPMQHEAFAVWATVDELRALPPIEAPKPIGPTSDPVPNGTWVDVEAHHIVNRAYWPRGVKALGDTHEMDLQVLPNGDLWYAKFGTAHQGELMSIDPAPGEYIRLRMDASHPTQVDVWPTDDRWLKKRMQVGRQYGLVLDPADLEKRKRPGCEVINRVNFSKEMWIEAYWPTFYCGPDLGERPVMRVVYNNTGYRIGQVSDNPELWVETYYMALDAADIWWTTDPSTKVFTAAGTVFPDPPSVSSVFARLGGASLPPNVPPCAPPSAPIGGVPVELPDPVKNTIRQFADAYPIPWAATPNEEFDEICRTWVRCLAQQVKARHGNTYGSKSASPTRPQTKDVLARLTGSVLEGWDVLTGVGTGSPRLSNFDWVDLTGQTFIAVTAKDRLGRISPRPKIRSDWHGMSAFDIGPRLDEGDTSWLTMMKNAGANVARMIINTRYRTARTFAQGRAQLSNVLARMNAAFQPMQLEPVLITDSLDIGASKDDMRTHVKDCNTRLLAFPSVIAGVELANEIGHPSQSPWLMDIEFAEELESYIDPRFPVAWGGWCEGGSYITIHPDRAQTAEQNAIECARRQTASGKQVVNDEPKGIWDIPPTNDQRTNDPYYGQQIARYAKQYGLAGVTLHLDAGLNCHPGDMGSVQQQAKTLFFAEFGPTPPVPGPDPILDHPLYPTDYGWFVANWGQIEAKVKAWHLKAKGTPASASDIAHGGIWRSTIEANRWKTLRAALQDTWPGGAP